MITAAKEPILTFDRLWEGEYKSSPIKVDEYLLVCCRYIEFNPLIEYPVKYKWSSYRYKVGNEQLNWFDFDPCYIRLGVTDRKRREEYKEWGNKSIPEEEWKKLR